MKTIIESLPELRYNTLGDYFYKDGVLHIQVLETGNEDYNFLIALHELIEEKLTKKRGIPEPQILDFDLWVESEIEKGRYKGIEPAMHPKSPYRLEHIIAENMEKKMAKLLNIKWKDYNNFLNTL